MKVLISPIGNQDPFGKPHKDTGDATPGSAVSICQFTQADKIILLPTKSTNGRDTMKNADETQEWIESEQSDTSVEILPVPMVAANNYAEAISAYGLKLRNIAAQYPDATLLLNASSGTPAIKLACMLFFAEGIIPSTPYYADDPTETRKSEANRIYTVDVTFLRESSLMQRTRDLLAHGQFMLAQEPLKTLKEGPFRSECQQWAGYWLRLSEALYLWDERKYVDASKRMDKLLREWQDASSELRLQLTAQMETLKRLASTVQLQGVMAWDIYFHALRLQQQGHLTSALEYFWIAVENSSFEYLHRKYGEGASDLGAVINMLRDKDVEVQNLWQQRSGNTTYGMCFFPLRDKRNACVHRGEVATKSMGLETQKLAKIWLSVTGSSEPSAYPLAPETLQSLSLLCIQV